MHSIPDFPGYYVDRLGNVWSTRYEGKHHNPEPRQLRPGTNEKGYWIVNLWIDGKSYMRKVARLMCNTFYGPRQSSIVTRHLNGNRKDNRISNLAWGTVKDNSEDSRRHGTLARGEAVGNATLTEQHVHAIRDSHEPNAVLARRYGVTNSAICAVRKRRTWKHIA